VVGYDTAEAMLGVARAKSQAVTWQQGDAAQLPFPDASFDLVLCVTALEFMADPSRALAEMARVVAPGGRLVVATLNAASPWGVALQREAQEQDTLYRHAHFYTPEELVSALSRLGRVRWNSAVFFAPNGQGLRQAALREIWGQTMRRGRGALLVGRVER
jgi:ubiquinone/menaquinone biosynthesis C-methylase UbiE